MIVLAQKIVKERERELMKWLKAQYRSAMHHKREMIKQKLYDQVPKAEGIASAYAYMIIHFDRVRLK